MPIRVIALDFFPRRHLNYTLGWQVNLADNHVAMAPYGGPVGKDLYPREAGGVFSILLLLPDFQH